MRKVDIALIGLMGSMLAMMVWHDIKTPQYEKDAKEAYFQEFKSQEEKRGLFGFLKKEEPSKIELIPLKTKESNEINQPNGGYLKPYIVHPVPVYDNNETEAKQ